MTTLDALQALDVPPLTLGVLTVATVSLVVSDPVLGRRDHRRFLAAVAADPAGGESARVRHYRRWTGQSWLWAVAAVVLVLALPGVGTADLGLRLPDLAGIGRSVWSDGAPTSGGDGLATLAGMVTGLALGMLAVVLARRVLDRRGHGGSGGRLQVAGGAALSPLLPTTPRERRSWTGLAFAAGITEEVTYRGLVVLTLAVLLPDADPRALVVAAAVLFGLAHGYQGWVGMLVTGLLGSALAGIYLGTGSLLIPMLLHVLIDLRPLLLPRPTGRAPATGTAGRTSAAGTGAGQLPAGATAAPTGTPTSTPTGTPSSTVPA